MKPFLAVVLLGLGACARVDQSESCRRYVACVRAADARDGVTTDAVRFEPEGACWDNETIAELCDRACVRALEVPTCE